MTSIKESNLLAKPFGEHPISPDLLLYISLPLPPHNSTTNILLAKFLSTMCPTGTTLQRGGKSNLRSAFDVLDSDGDGKISHEDLRAFYGGVSGAEASGEGVIESMISVADSNKDGFVEYDEFEKVLEAKKGKDRRNGVMEDAFRVMDKDGDGKVGHDDLKSYLNWAGFEADDEDVKAMIRLGGGDDQNGGVTFQGFLKVLAL